MPDLDPLPNAAITPPIIQDPGVTRVVQHFDDPEEVKYLANVARTSCSFVLLDGAANAVHLAQETAGFSAAKIRREFLVIADGDQGETAASLRGSLTGTGVTWKVCDKVMGGRASVLAEAVEYAANEFLVVSFGTDLQLGRIPNLLGHMWVEGADVGVFGGAARARQIVGHVDDPLVGLTTTPDAALQLTHWLGLGGHTPENCVVVMRRWVARWLFNEISRSIDPAEELADRARLLGLTIVHLT